MNKSILFQIILLVSGLAAGACGSVNAAELLLGVCAGIGIAPLLEEEDL